MAVQGGSDPVPVTEMRGELDELLRAHQYAVQRERRLATELQAAGQNHPAAAADGAAAQRLAQARAYREQLGAECHRLSRRLLEAEEQARWTATGSHPTAPAPAAAPAVPPQQRRHGGARFGGAYPAEETPAPRPPAAAPPVGARFGGRPATEQPGAAQPRPPAEPGPTPPRRPTDPAALAARVGELHATGRGREAVAVVAEAALALTPEGVAALTARLRAEGPTGAAAYLARSVTRGPAGHVASVLALLRRAELAEEAQELFHQLWSWPADRLVPLFEALERTGQAADAATLLWESASAPPEQVAALAAALADAHREPDLRSLLGQAASRSAPEVAAVVAALADAGRTAEGGVLLDAAVRGRQAGDIAELASLLAGGADPSAYGRLLAAAEEAPAERRRDIAAALRLAGLPLHVDAVRRGRLGRRKA